ncbi:MAG: hypothetical protein RLZZ126_237, partial [Pseudomonadota bacterium]
MIQPQLAPSTALTWFSRCSSALLGLAVLGWLVWCVAWAALHWVIVPRAGEFRHQMEAWASEALGLRVSIGRIRAYSNGLIPSLEFSDVRLRDAQGRDALVLGRVVTAVSIRSALAMGFDQLYIDQPQLDIRRDTAGRVWVGGLDVTSPGSSDGSLADWLFSQPEVVLHGGVLRWRDDMLPRQSLELQQVNVVLRNAFRRHELRLDATPQADVGEALQLRAKFRQPVFERREGHWQSWSGQMYAQFQRVDLARLNSLAGLKLDSLHGAGALRAWAEVSRGELGLTTVDLALGESGVTLDPDLPPLQLRQLSGRLSGNWHTDGFDLNAQGLSFQTQDGVSWPGGRISVSRRDGTKAGRPADMKFKADELDLAALSQVALRIPLPPHVRAQLALLQPQGKVLDLQAQWAPDASDAESAARSLVAKGRIDGLRIQSPQSMAPGVSGLSAAFDLGPRGGKARLSMQQGTVSLPGILEDSIVPFTQLEGDITWQLDGEKIALQIPKLLFANADAQGYAEVKWQSVTANPAQGRGRFPGHLDLQAVVDRMNGARVHRYLPAVIPKPAREYVRLAIHAGEAKKGKIIVRGDLYDFPFRTAPSGDFKIQAQFTGLSFAFVPPGLQAAGSLPWPELSSASGEFAMDKMSLFVKEATGRIGPRGSVAPISFSKANAVVPDLVDNPTVEVGGDARGGVGAMLSVVNGSPLRDLLGRTLVEASGTGAVQLNLKLAVPIRAPTRTTVQGQLALQEGDIRIASGVPPMSRARGAIRFTEGGFALVGLQGRMFGGDIVLNGGTDPAAGGQGGGAFPPLLIRASGRMTAEALRQSRDWAPLAGVAQFADGAADYQAVYGLRNGQSDLVVTSNLVGMALKLPHPLGKAAEAPLPVRYQEAPPAASTPGRTASHSLMRLDIGRVMSAAYLRDTETEPVRVLRGTVVLGPGAGEPAALPQQGVLAQVQLGRIDLDAWGAVLDKALGAKVSLADLAPVAGGSGTTPALAQSVAAYLPSQLNLRTTDLTLGGRKFNSLRVNGSRSGNTWQANVEAEELEGYLEYRQATASTAGRVHARLARLTLAPSTAREVEDLLDNQPTSIPALDVVVDDLQLRGKHLGRVEVDAINRAASPGGPREWRLNKFNLSMPEASFTATGNWVSLNAQGPRTGPASVTTGAADRRRTVMNFKMDINDAGLLLRRLGMKDVIRQG